MPFHYGDTCISIATKIGDFAYEQCFVQLRISTKFLKKDTNASLDIKINIFNLSCL